MPRPYLRLTLASLAALLLTSSGVVHVSLAAQTNDDDAFVPVTDAMLQESRAGRLADVASDARRVGLQPAR